VSKPTALARATVQCIALLICVIALAAPLAAQAQRTPERRSVPPVPSPSPTPAPNVPPPTGNHDLSITANVTARELLFEVVPNPVVEFPGQPRRDTVWEAERTNLPPQVQPGVTYRDIGIRLKITSVFADIERIVAEALGEIPANDNVPQQLEPNTSVAPQTDSAQSAASSASRADNILPAKSPTQQTSQRASSGKATRARSSSTNNRNSALPRQRRP